MLKLVNIAVAAWIVSGCASKIDDLKSEKMSSTIPVTEVDGVVSGNVSASASSDQVIVASANSKVADALVIFPPGSLAVATDIAVGQAADKSTAILAEVGITDALKASTPVYVGTASGTVPDVLEPLIIQLPLPLDEDDTSLVDDAHKSKLILIYAIYNNGWKSGVVPLTVENLIGTFTKVPLKGMGYFQIVYVNSSTGEKQVVSAVVPSLGK